MAKIEDIRNIVLLGHGGSGKTSLAEAILHRRHDQSSGHDRGQVHGVRLRR